MVFGSIRVSCGPAGRMITRSNCSSVAEATRSARPGWRASDLELRSPAPSFTSTTLQKFHERGYGAGVLFFVIGADAFADIGTWRDYPGILQDAHFAVVSRPGVPGSLYSAPHFQQCRVKAILDENKL